MDQIRPSLIQIMACRLVAAKPLSEPVLFHCRLDPLGANFILTVLEVHISLLKKMHL